MFFSFFKTKRIEAFNQHLIDSHRNEIDLGSFIMYFYQLYII